MLVALKRQGADLDIAQELGEFSTMLALVATGLGIGVIPSEATIALPPKVVARPLDLGGHLAGIGLAYTRLDSAAKRALSGVMEQGV
jgi:DNA-binding transcriptional LysR family regulator